MKQACTTHFSHPNLKLGFQNGALIVTLVLYKLNSMTMTIIRIRLPFSEPLSFYLEEEKKFTLKNKNK